MIGVTWTDDGDTRLAHLTDDGSILVAYPDSTRRLLAAKLRRPVLVREPRGDDQLVLDTERTLQPGQPGHALAVVRQLPASVVSVLNT